MESKAVFLFGFVGKFGDYVPPISLDLPCTSVNTNWTGAILVVFTTPSTA